MSALVAALRTRQMKAILAIAAATTALGVVVAEITHDALLVACLGAFGVFLIGVALWLMGQDRASDEIGRGIMVAVLLALVLGVPQYLLDQQRKQRDAKSQSAL